MGEEARLPGISAAPIRKASVGTAAAANIHRQPVAPFHDAAAMAAAPAPGATGAAVSQVTTCAPSRPGTSAI
jgi:hypothetical protein